MAATYCTTTQVIQQLGLQKKDGTRYDGSGLPSTDEITEAIEDIEDEIDRHCNTSWKSTTVTNEYHSFPFRRGFYWRGFWFNGYYIQLGNRYITTLASGTDKIEVWRGSSWTDLVATGSAGSGPRDGDYFLLPEEGIIYLNTTLPTLGENTIRITYRYQRESTVPKGIRRAAKLLAAAELIESNLDYGNINIGNDFSMDNQTKAEAWRKRAEMLMDKEYVFVSIPQR